MTHVDSYVCEHMPDGNCVEVGGGPAAAGCAAEGDVGSEAAGVFAPVPASPLEALQQNPSTVTILC